MTDDKDIKKIKRLFETKNPGDVNIQKWKMALRQRRIRQRQLPLWAQLTVAASVGFVVGGLVFSNMTKSEEKVELAATIESVYTKL